MEGRLLISSTQKSPNGKLSRTGPDCFMVTKESACQIGDRYNHKRELPLDSDHSNLVNFSDQSDDAYTRVLVKNAPRAVESRFSSKKDMS